MEQDENRWKLIRSMRGQAECFVNAAPNGKYSFFKKLGRKLTYWYVYPFGEAQNRFNDSAAALIEQLSEDVEKLQVQLEELETQTERRFVTFTREQRQILERSEAAQAESLEKLTETVTENDEKQRRRMMLFEESQRKTLTITRAEQMRAIEKISKQVQEQAAALDGFADEVDRSLSAAAPDSRRNAGTPALLYPDGSDPSVLAEPLCLLETAKDDESVQSALEQLDAAYTEYLHDTFETCINTRNIVFVCREYTGGAAQRELRALYSLMKKNSRYPVSIVSVEAEDAPEMMQGDIYRVPEPKLADWMRAHDPALLIFCEENPSLLTAGGQCMMLRESIVRLSTQDPVEKIGGSKMQELLHLCEYGVQHYSAASSGAADAFEQHGFCRPAVSAPYVDVNDPSLYRRPHPYDASMFTVGYLDDAQDSDAMALFMQTVRANPDIDFLIYTEHEVPVETDILSNCDCCTDSRELRDFFGEVDCVIVPYAGAKHVPAVPLSALDAMVMGIPAVSTPAAGIAELIAETGIGLVSAESTAESLGEALHTLRAGYAAYCEGWRIAHLRELVSGKAFVKFAEECAGCSVPSGMVTLYDWDRAVKQEGAHLVRGSAAMRAYFQRRMPPAPAENYREAALDLMERRSAEALLSHYCTDENRRLILALAGEDDQMLRMLMQFGVCTFADASQAVNTHREEVFAGKRAAVRKMDILAGNLEGQYDVIAVFRLIRHLESPLRRQVWARLAAALTENGIILADIPNLMHLVPFRQQNGWGKQAVYEVGWTADRIAAELRENGLRLEAMLPIGQGLFRLPAPYDSEPVSWTAVIKKEEKNTGV
ncbi:MAG: glycosyltransferase [Oscillospiraceae bacterium]|nr:glycosyltransferase [Oscillospiraceae bacterium]